MEGTSPVGWLCLVPPLLTIVLAIATRRVVLSLLAGIASAVAILLPTQDAYELILGTEATGAEYWSWTIGQFFIRISENHLWASLVDQDHIRVFVFTSVLGIQIALIHLSGGMLGIVRWAEPLARTRRGGQVMTWLLGLIVFIDDYANTLLLGSTMRPLTDRLKISREKLAFLVDSTAAPVSGLALVSTWVATEISTMEAGYTDAGIDIGSGAFGIFLQTIPSRFYILYALAFVFLCAITCRDYGPMLAAERAASNKREDETDPHANQRPARPLNAILPIFVTVAVVVWLLIQTGLAAVGDAPLPNGWIQSWGTIIGQGSSYVALVYGSLAGLGVVLALILLQRDVASSRLPEAALKGFAHILPAMVILWLAWTLSNLTGKDHLRTGAYLAANLSDINLAPGFMPSIVFVLASGIAFSTGTSWGTMAILMPIVIPLVFGMLELSLGSPPPVDHFVLTGTIASVLAGAIFGDHCSPISDTTILSSRSSDCDHIAHVRTQIPYALTIGIVAILFGTLPAGFGINSYLLLPVGCAVMLGVLLTVGKRV